MGTHKTEGKNFRPRSGCLWVLVPLVALIGFVIIYRWPETHRYRMTVEVETPEGLRTGSSVIEVTSRREIRILPEMHIRSSTMRGEAVAVDLPGGQTLFALLRGEGNRHFGNLNGDALGPPGAEARKLGADPAAIPRKIMSRNAAGEPIEISGLPILVRFRNIRNPASVELVDPDNLAASFGKAVSLRRITLQVTDDPVTTDIKKRLPWLLQYYDRMLDGHRLNDSKNLANNLSAGDFLLGELK